MTSDSVEIHINGRYRNVVRKLSHIIFLLSKYTCKNIDTIYEYGTQKDILDDDYPLVMSSTVNCTDLDIKFIMGVKIQLINGLNGVAKVGSTYSDEDSDTDLIPYVEFGVLIDPNCAPEMFHILNMELRDVIRHELEHLTQWGYNCKPGKYINSELPTRLAIDEGIVPKWKYLILPREVDANIQGLLLQSKKERVSFKDRVTLYFNQYNIESSKRTIILNVWRNRLKHLGLNSNIL